MGMLQRGPLLYPFLFAAYPILFLWSRNIEEISVYSSRIDILLPVTISASIALLLLAVFRVILRDWRSAGLLVAFVFLLFFSYGHVLESMHEYGPRQLAKNRYLIVAWPVIFVAGAVLLLRFRANLTKLTNPLNVMSLSLALFTLPNIIAYVPPSAALAAAPDTQSFPAAGSTSVEGGTPPDIYYITTEGYSNARSLKLYLDYDNTPFIGYLESKQFFVAHDSRSNYGETVFSLTSSLNMEYHVPGKDGLATGPAEYYWRLQNNKAMRFARELGYTVVYLSERFPAGSKELGDIFFGCGARRLAIHTERFADALLHTTALQPILTKFGILASGHRDQRLCQFFQVANSKDIAGPKVVVIHLVVPGFPFVVGRNGEPVSDSASSANPAQAYVDQLVWTNKMLQWLIESLLSDQDYSPVIIIQGDHGAGWANIDLDDEQQLRHRFGIMNAYHLPDGGDKLLYPSISPVNTFRVILNYYLNADFDLLEDRSYLTPENSGFIDVTDVVSRVSKD